MLGESPGVNTIYPRDTLLVKPHCKRPVGLPMGMIKRIILSYNGPAMYVVALIILAHIILLSVGRDSIVSQYRVSRHQYLTLIGWVGQTLRITRHCGIKHYLTGR